MKKLEKLTAEQTKLLEVNRDKFINKFLNNEPINMDKAKKAIEFVYSLISLPMPKIYEAADPLEAQKLANELCGTEKKYYATGTYLTIYWASFYAWAETYIDLGVITKENNPKYFELREVIDSNIFSTIEFDKAIILVPKPQYIKRNTNGMHSVDSPAIQWANGYGQYFVQGRAIPQKYFDSITDKTFTVEDFAKEQNEEIKSVCIAMIQEKWGDEYLVQFFREHLKEVDTFVDKKAPEYLEGTTGGMNIGVYTLFKGEINETDIAYVRCYCPSTDRMFFLGVSEEHTSAKDAIASLYRIPKKVSGEIKYINRQGERFTTVLTDKGQKIFDSLSKEEVSNVVSISGNEYFSKIKYEY